MIGQAITIAYFTVLEAIRNRLFIFTVVLTVSMFGFSGFIGELAITETEQVQSVMLGFILRLFSIFMVSLFVITSMVREFDDKGFELLLSLPMHRWSYYLGKLTGFVILSFIITILIGLPLITHSGFLHVVYWEISLLCELVIMVTASLFCLFTFGNVTISFAIVTVFYLLSRTISAIRLMSENPILADTSFVQDFMGYIITCIAVFMPDFSIFTRSEWLIYGLPPDGSMSTILIQTIIYTFLLSCASLFDLYRKNF